MPRAKRAPGSAPLPKGLKWINLCYDDFNRRFPRIGIRRLTERVEAGDKSAEPKLAELKEYVWRYRRRRKYRYPGRYSPEKRRGSKFKSIIIPLDTYHKIKEIQKFYKAGMGAIIKPLIDELFDKTYKEAELLARIEASRKKQNETPDADKPKRRTHF
jgi:hypothetical protein